MNLQRTLLLNHFFLEFECVVLAFISIFWLGPWSSSDTLTIKPGGNCTSRQWKPKGCCKSGDDSARATSTVDSRRVPMSTTLSELSYMDTLGLPENKISNPSERLRSHHIKETALGAQTDSHGQRPVPAPRRAHLDHSQPGVSMPRSSDSCSRNTPLCASYYLSFPLASSRANCLTARGCAMSEPGHLRHRSHGQERHHGSTSS
jgi:hypothetical protein